MKYGCLGATPGKILETTPLRTSENASFNRYLLLYNYIYLQSGSKEISTSIKTDTHQHFHDINNFLANQNKKGPSTGGDKTL